MQLAVTRCRKCRPDDRGAALVEFALILPVFMILVLGMFSGGMAYNRKQQMTASVREGARYGGTIPADQAFASGTWASNVRDLVVARSAGDLTSAQVCVSLVQGSPAATVSSPGGAARFSTRSDTLPCIEGETYPVTANDNGRRVQVTATRPDQIDVLFGEIPLVLRAQGTVRAESSG